METGASGGGNTYYTLQNINGNWFVMKNSEVLYSKATAYGGSISSGECEDENIAITKSVNSFGYTLSYKKNCEVTQLLSGGTYNTSSKTAGTSEAYDVTTKGFVATF